MVDQLSSMLIDGMGRTVVDDGSGVTEHRLFAPPSGHLHRTCKRKSLQKERLLVSGTSA